MSNTESPLPTSATLLELPIGTGKHEAPIYLVVQITHLKQRSLFIWCGEAGANAANIVAQQDAKEDDEAAHAERKKSENKSQTSSLLIEEHHPTARSGAPVLEGESTQPPPVTGLLARDWSVAMSSRNPNHQTAIATSLFRSTLDLSKPMAARLAKRYELGQVFLSIHLPDQISEMLEGPYTDPIGQKLLLEIEGGIGKCVQASFATYSNALPS